MYTARHSSRERYSGFRVRVRVSSKTKIRTLLYEDAAEVEHGMSVPFCSELSPSASEIASRTPALV